MNAPPCLPSATRPINPELSALLRSLKPGQRIKITQTIRVGSRGQVSISFIKLVGFQ